MSQMVLSPLLAYVREVLTRVLQPGDRAVDGTVGNGHDTQFLATVVGPTGQVVGFDVQAAALASAQERLAAAGVAERCTLVLASHAEMQVHVPADWRGTVRAVTFNLGYLPGGDKAVVTTAQSTLPALQAALDLLAPGGVMTVALYVGHPGGAAEADAVLQWAQSVPQETAHVLQYRFLNQINHPPMLLAFEKRR